MVLKYRQGGVTTGEIIKQLDYVCFNKNKTACIMADEQKNMERIFSRVRLAHRHMPSKIRPVLGKGGGSKYEMVFPELNSRIYCTIEGRGDTINWLHISEAAFAKPERVRATLEAVPVDSGIATWESTPNGMGNHFYRQWVTPHESLEKLFFPWFFHKEYKLPGTHINTLTDDEKKFIKFVKDKYAIDITKEQIAFRRSKQYDLRDMFPQEYPEDDISCFLASGGAAMDLDKVHSLLKNTPEPLEDTGTMKIFKHYDSKKVYACGADTAEGVGGDYSVATIYEVGSREEVAQIRSNRWRPREFAHEIFNLCKKYTKDARLWPLLGVERNNHGHAVLLELDEHLHYQNLYHRKRGDKKDESPGWVTDSITRPLMINAFRDGVENGTAQINSRDTLGECLTLIDNNGKIEAEEGETDDCIIAGAIGLQMCIEMGQVDPHIKLEKLFRI